MNSAHEDRGAGQRTIVSTQLFASSADQQKLARALACFGIGLGCLRLFAPRAVERFLGLRQHEFLIRLGGAREIAAGFGILAERHPGRWLWVRFAGDILDAAGLTAALAARGSKPGNIALAAAAVTGVGALDFRCARGVSATDRRATERPAATVRKSIHITRTPQQVYRFWRELENLPRFMSNLESVRVISEERSHWVAVGPAEKRIEWDAEIVEDEPDRLIAWRSLEGAPVSHAGSVRFEAAPGGRGSFVRVQIEYHPPGGIVGTKLAQLFGRAPEQQVEEDLRHLKQVLETGSILTTEGQPAGRSQSTSWKYDRTVRRRRALP